jgi:hypothetical protein
VRTVGVTGHRELTEQIRAHVRVRLAGLLGRRPVLGLSSLADGADQLFAETVLNRGGRLHAVIPAAGYEKTVVDEDAYRRLLAAASRTTVLDFAEAGPEAYGAAGRFIVERCDLLIAVWDGRRARGPGGTFSTVSYARSVGREVAVCWPDGAVRPWFLRKHRS